MKSAQVTKSFQILFWGVFLLALISRFYGLTFKPIHFDESINGWFAQKMIADGYYQYDPNNYHGPLYFYLLRFFEMLWGTSLNTLRTLPAIFSIAAIMIYFWGWARSRSWNLWMAALLLFSPAFVFYGRSGIHEMPFVFFQMLWALGIMRWIDGARDGRSMGLILMGLFGMTTLKETFAIVVVASVAGLLILGPTAFKENFRLANFKGICSRKLKILSVILVLFFVGLFTGFGMNLAGILDFIRAFLPWMKTGTHGAGHEKEFLYWIKTLWEAEPLALVGVLLSALSLWSRDLSLRWVSVMGLVQLAIYSLIPYKTVWCILSLIWPFYFVLAAYLERAFQSKMPWKVLASAILLLGIFLDGRSLWHSSYRNPIDLEHPFVYVNSTYEQKHLSEVLLRAAKENPEVQKLTWQLGGAEQWPWPWVLRSVQSLNFTSCRDRILDSAAIYLCDADLQDQVESALHEPYFKMQETLRQGQHPSVIYFKATLFEPYLSNVEKVGPEKGDTP